MRMFSSCSLSARPGVTPAEASSRPDVGFGFSSYGEPRDRFVIPDDLGELLQEFVHPPVSFGRERADRLGQILGVVVRRRHVRPRR